MCRAILTTIGILFIWAVVSVVSSDLQLPDVVSIVMPLIATSIWAGFDAHKIEFKKYKTSLGTTVYGGGGVFAAVLLLWIIFFPWYLFSRGKILSGKAKLRDEYEGEAAKEGETVLLQDSSKRKKSKFRYILGVIITGLIFFCLFFRVVILSGDFTVIAKKHPTFSNTFVNLDDYIKRGNIAIEKYNADGSISFTQQRPLENYLLEQNLDVELWKEFMEKGLMMQKGKNKE